MDRKAINTRLVAAKLVAICISQSACGVASYGGDGITITGSPEGIRAYHDGLNGILTNGKASPDADTPYYQLRREQNRAQAMRYTSFGRKEGK